MILSIDKMRDTYSAKAKDRYEVWGRFFASFLTHLRTRDDWVEVSMIVGVPGSGKSTYAERLNTEDNLILDSPNLTYSDRAPLIAMAKHYDVLRIVAYYLHTPLEVCLRRNAGRENPVPEVAVKRRYDRVKPPRLFEGFDAIDEISRHEQRII